MKKILAKTIADKGGVCINGINFMLDGDGIKTVVLTDEREFNGYMPWIDLRETDLKIWQTDCNPEDALVFTRDDLETWGVAIIPDWKEDILYLAKF